MRRHDASAAEELTPQELQIARVVARGATNREAGAALFVSPKTVEYRLGRVYRKIGVRSRTELARLVAEEEDGLEDGGSLAAETARSVQQPRRC